MPCKEDRKAILKIGGVYGTPVCLKSLFFSVSSDGKLRSKLERDLAKDEEWAEAISRRYWGNQAL